MFRRPTGRFAPYLALALAAAVIGGIWLLSPPDARRALANSLILASGATVIAVPIGTFLALLIARFDLPGRRLAAACLGLLLFLPLYVQLAGWDAAFGKIGWATLLYGQIDRPLLSGMRAVIFIHALAAIPWVSLIVGIGLRQVDPTQEEAALLVMPPRRVLWRVTLPQTLPFIVAAALWTVVGTVSEMTVSNIFLINPGEWTYTEQFYMTFSLQADPDEAALAILPGAGGLAVLIGLALWMVLRYIQQSTRSIAGGTVAFSAGSLRRPFAGLLWLLVAGLLAIPIASLISIAGFLVVRVGEQRMQSWSLVRCVSQVAMAPWRFRDEFFWTIVTATGAATLALVASIALAWTARRGGWRVAPAVIAVVLGLTIPGPLVGVGLIWLLNRPLWPGVFDPLVWLYDQRPFAPLLAQAIRALPLVTLLVWHSFRALDSDVLAAAALDGAKPWQLLWRIALPQRRTALAGAWLAAFAIAAGDLAWANLVRPAGMDLIQRRVFGLVHSGVEEQVAAISLVNVIAYALLATLILRLLGARRAGFAGQDGIGGHGRPCDL